MAEDLENITYISGLTPFTHEKLTRDREAKLLGGFQVDDQPKLR
jgi:hypothetical protein